MGRARLRDLTVNDPPMEEIIRELYGRAQAPAATPGSFHGGVS
jgi:hypothetical protein